jgi:hypothetical protein
MRVQREGVVISAPAHPIPQRERGHAGQQQRRTQQSPRRERRCAQPGDPQFDAAHVKYWADAYGESDLRLPPNGEAPYVTPDDHEFGGVWSLALVPASRPTRPFSLSDFGGSRWIATHA